MLTIRKTSGARANKKEIENKQNEATIYLYGDIGGWFGIDHQEFIKNLNDISAKTIHLRIDSSGGDIFAARAMKTAIMQHPAKVVAHIDGLAASAASFFAMGADEIEIVDGGFLMIHNALSLIDILGFFNIDDLDGLISDMTKERDFHVKINESIANDYMKKSGNSQEKVLEWMSEETWFTAQEALDNKFVDRIYDGEPVEGSYDLAIFGNIPDEIKARNKDVTKKTIEKALRDAGLTNKEAKTFLSKGFSAIKNERDAHDDSTVKPERDVQIEETPLRDAEPDPPEPVRKKDRTEELLIKAALLAP